MKKVNITGVLTAVAVILIFYVIHAFTSADEMLDTVRVGFVYIGDGATAYTYNFMKSREALERTYGEKAVISEKYNILEEDAEAALQELAQEGCDIIFSTSHSYAEVTRKIAGQYPGIQFCQVTGEKDYADDALGNYHSFMGEIEEGRYVSGIAAGLKLSQLLEDGIITMEQAKVGYVAAYPIREVTLGYEAFCLGVRSVVPQAQAVIQYTDTWGSYSLEKEAAKALIEEGCVIVSQHSDTTGPAAACESAGTDTPVYHIGYNRNMSDIAPTTHITSSRINWEPYILTAVEAVRKREPIEKLVEGNIDGNHASAGLREGWVEMTEINDVAAAAGTKERLDEAVSDIEQGRLTVFGEDGDR